MHTFIYDPKLYFYRNTLTGYALIAIALYSIFEIVTNFGLSIWLVILLVSAYGAINQFVTVANPREAGVSGDTIYFTDGRIKHTYEISQLKSFQIKEIGINGSIFIRIADTKGMRARYWLAYRYFNDSDKLLAEMYYIERKLNPDHIKFRGRDEWGKERPDYTKQLDTESTI